MSVLRPAWPAAGVVFLVTLHAHTSFTYIYTLAPRYCPDVPSAGGERFPRGAALYLVSGSERRPIAPDVLFSADAFLSYDGTRVLFSGKRTSAEPWQIWEVPVRGGAARRVTDAATDCTRPVYLPGGRIVYTRREAAGSVLESIAAEGGYTARLTFAPGTYLLADILRDGRILFESVRSEAGGVQRDLFTVYPDGSGVESLRCEHGPERTEARQFSSGEIAFRSGGKLARIRSGSAHQTWFLPGLSGAFGPLAEISPDQWIFAARKTQAGNFGLYISDSSGKHIATLENPESASAVQPVIVAPRTAPRDFPSGLQPSRRAANMLCLGAQNSMDPIRGVARRVRVYTQDVSGRAIVLGETSIAGDGSFFAQAPGDRPLRFELLDAHGEVLRSQRNWIWLRTGEQRICAGCHAGPEAAPENRLPEALRGAPKPVVLADFKNGGAP